MSDKEIPEVKSLRWLALQFPIVQKPKDDAERLQSCIYLYCTAAADLIELQNKEIEKLRNAKVVYETVDYCSADLVKALKEIDRLKAEVEKERHLNDKRRMDYGDIRAEAFKEFAERVKQTICDNTYPDFDRKGKPVNVWNAVNGYKAIDGLVDELLKEEAQK